MKRISKRLLISLSLIAMMAFAVGMGTYAYFTSQATSTANVFTAGTLTVGLKANGVTATPTVSNAFSVSGNLEPGMTVTKKADGTPGPTVIEIKNNGDVNLAEIYKFVTNDTGTYKLSNMLYFHNLKFEFLDSNGTPDIWEPTEYSVTNGVVNNIYGYPALAGGDGKLSLAEWNSSNGMGAGLGVGMGALKPGYSYRITFELRFDEAATNDYQGKSMNGNFVVHATQINANALDALFTAHGNDTGFELVGPGRNHLTWLNLQIAKQ